MEEREGGSLHFTMGPEMGSDGQVTGWDPPRRVVYEEDWAALMGKDPWSRETRAMGFHVAGEPESDAVLDEYPFAILLDMMLDHNIS